MAKNKKEPVPDSHPDLFSARAPQPVSSAGKPAPALPVSQRVEPSGPFPIKLDKPLVFLDLEATGLDIREDRIVELSALKLHPDGTRESFNTRLNPGIRIPVEATAIHGISDADVQAAPSFKDIAEKLFAFLSNCDLGGFGVSRYDVHLLAQEFKRTGIDFTDTGRRLVDAQIIYHKREPRDLGAALKYYRGRDLVGAHGAKADCEASLEVFLGELERYPDLPRDVAGLHGVCNQTDDRFVDAQGRLFWRHGEACFNFGKYRSQTLEEVSRSDRGYLQWLIGEGKSSPELLEIYRRSLLGYYPKKPV